MLFKPELNEDIQGCECWRTYIVRCPPWLKFKVPLQPGSQILLEVFSQALHPVKLLVIHQRPHWLQVLSKERTAKSQRVKQSLLFIHGWAIRGYSWFAKPFTYSFGNQSNQNRKILFYSRASCRTYIHPFDLCHTHAHSPFYQPCSSLSTYTMKNTRSCIEGRHHTASRNYILTTETKLLIMLPFSTYRKFDCFEEL